MPCSREDVYIFYVRRCRRWRKTASSMVIGGLKIWLALTSDPQSAAAANPKWGTSLPIGVHVLEGSRLVAVRLTPRTYRDTSSCDRIPPTNKPLWKHVILQYRSTSDRIESIHPLCSHSTRTRPGASNMLPQTISTTPASAPS
jgi:hypothetical protein